MYFSRSKENLWYGWPQHTAEKSQLHGLESRAVQWFKSYIYQIARRALLWMDLCQTNFPSAKSFHKDLYLDPYCFSFIWKNFKNASYHHLYLCMLMIFLLHSSIVPATLEEKLNKVYVRSKSFCYPINARYMSKRQNNCMIYYERFEPRSHFMSRLCMIVRVNAVLNRTVVDSDWRFVNLCGSHLQSQSELYHVRQLMV